MAELPLPPAWDADAAPEREISLDESFSFTLGQLMTGMLSPEAAVMEWARACEHESRRIYNLSRDFDDSSRACYEEELQELRDECDTWSLIAHMFSSDDPKSGPCPVSVNPSENPGYGSMISFMQQIVSVTMHHAELRRVAQMIAWLEDQSMRDLVRRSTGQLADSLEEFGVTAGYTRQEAVQKLLASTRPSNLSSQDPDANSWQTRAETTDHCCIAEDEQMLSAVYTLLRAGSEPLAANLCVKASCGWRAAIMGAAGWGLLPVGDAATKGQFRRDVQCQHTAIAADILARHGCFDESSSSYVNAACSVRERWRAACAAAAAAAEQRSGTGSTGAIAAAYERAIFGVLAGSEQHCQASCKSWQDRLWVWGRAVLQSEPEQRLLEDTASTTNDTIPAPCRLRPWQQQNLVNMPSELSGPPNARKNGDILEQATVVLNEIEAVEGINARLHHSFQRLLAKAALAPLSMMQNEEKTHPLRDLLEKMLSVADMPVASPTIAHHRIRFAAHCGLALVSLGAIPGNPEDTEHLWNAFSDCLPGHLLEAINHITDVYIMALIQHPDGVHRELLPQYICLLRPSLTSVTLRRCITALMPGPPADVYQRSKDSTAVLTDSKAITATIVSLQNSILSRGATWVEVFLDTSLAAGDMSSMWHAHIQGHIKLVVEPPAAECFTRMLSPEAWHEGSILLETLLHWFEAWHCNAPGAAPRPDRPHLPRTTVQFDAVLCETVREAVRSIAISNIDRVAMVKWLLLPFQMRKDMLEPFLGGEGATAHVCWICTVQAVFVALDICRRSAICGVGYQYSAYALLKHMFGDSYASQVPLAAQQPTDEDIDTISQRNLLDAVVARCELLEQQEESQLLIALQRAIHELQEWHDILSAMDQLARFSRAVTVAANGFLVGANIAEVLSAVAGVGSRQLLSGNCYVPQTFSGDMGIEMCVRTCSALHDGAQPVRNIWGSSAEIDAPVGMPEPDATDLAAAIATALSMRLHSSATWHARGLPKDVVDTVDVQAIAEAIEVALDESDRQPQAAVRFRVALSGVRVRAAVSFTDQPQAVSDAVGVCLDVLATAITDLLRGDLLEHGSTMRNKSRLEVLGVTALAAQDTWETAIGVHTDDSTRGVHAAHVHGDTLGRFSLLRAMAGRMVLADLGIASSRLQLWAAQLAIVSGSPSDVRDVRDVVEGCGVCVNERALEVMSTVQLCEFLANTQLATLHGVDRRASASLFEQM